ncbi:MAG: hypothetical protein KC731_25355 [Myxococcales bacterium]|nr:hypothetical protein [Myxococcales bacterium]
MRGPWMALALLALAGVAGCKDEKGDQRREDEGGDTPRSEVKGDLDGKEVQLKHALVVSRGTQALWVHLSTEPLECKGIAPGSVTAKGTETLVALSLNPQLQPSGEVAWKIIRGNYSSGKSRGRVLDKDASFTFEKGNAAEGLTGVLQATLSEDKDKGKLSFSGKLVAKGCGERVFGKGPEPRPQKGVKVTIAGHAFDIQGARLLPEAEDGVTTLELATQPRDCNRQSYPAGDAGVSVKLEGDPPQAKHLWFRGDMLASNYNSDHEPKGTFTIGPVEGGVAKVEMHYTHKVFGFEVVLEGEVAAQQCPKKKKPEPPPGKDGHGEHDGHGH